MKKNNSSTNIPYLRRMLIILQKRIKMYFSQKNTFINMLLVVLSIILTIWIFNKILIEKYSNFEFSQPLKRDIISPINFSIEDIDAMNKIYNQKKSEVSAVFIVEQSKFRIFKENIINFFNYVKQLQKLNFKIAKKKLLFQYPFLKNLSDNELRKLLNIENYDEIENYLFNKMQTFYSQGFISSKNKIMSILKKLNKKNTLIVLENNNTNFKKDLYEIPDLNDIIKTINNDLLFRLNAPLLTILIKNLALDNILFDYNKTLENERKSISHIEPIIKNIHKGELLFKKGQKLTDKDIRFLNYLKNFISKKLRIRKRIGVLLFIGLIFFLFFYFPEYNKKLLSTTDKNFILFITYTIFLIIMDFIYYGMRIFPNAPISQLLLPFSFYVYTIALFIDRRFAFYNGILVSLLSSILFDNDISIIFYGIINTIFTLHLTKKVIKRSSLFFSFLIIGILSSFSIIFFDLIMGIKVVLILKHVEIIVIGNILSYIGLISILPLYESFFDISTPFEMVELLSGEHELIKRLALHAPGTYQHSIALSYLAESAAKAIGADPILAKVGALFHDIGKINKAQYFIENQKDKKNPHDNISPVMSAKILRQHVIYGYQLSLEYMLPKPIRKIILEHHGTGLISYFYQKAIAKNNKENVDINEFRYQGNKPSFKESAIIMFGDKVEAQSRVLKSYKYTDIKKMVMDTLMDILVKEEQLSDAPITLKELYLVAESFIDTLKNMYHKRIEYEENNNN